jgi:type IV pilus assembly protein PilA
MKSEFKAKYLQHLVRKNKGNEGFTLIELLVVIIIVGVLAAIALPSFLNQIGKARGSEAKSNIGVVNRAQQAYRLENATFATALSQLDAKIDGKYYTYTPTSDVYTTKTLATTTNKDLKVYAGGVAQSGNDSSIKVILCESVSTSGNSATNTADVTMGASASAVATASCSAGNAL